MGIIGTIVVGFVIGVLAKLLHPGRENMGFVLTTILGIVGSLVATFVGQALGIYQAGQTAGFVGGIIGAIIVLAVYGRLQQRASGL